MKPQILMCFFSSFFIHSLCFLILGNGNAEYEHILLFSVLMIGICPILFAFVDVHKNPLMAFISFFAGLFIAQFLFSFFYSYSPCSPKEFALFALLQILPTYGLTYFLSLVYSRFDARNKWSRFQILIGHLMFFMSAVLFLVFCLYFFPQKRITNVVFGYIHGPIYDRWIPLDSGVFLARCFHFTYWMLGIVWLKNFNRISKKNSLIFGTFVFTLIVISQVYLQKLPSQSMGQKALEKHLVNIYEDEQIKIFADHELEIKFPNELNRIVQSAKIYKQQIMKKMNLTKVPFTVVYIYKDDDQKKLLFGGGTTDVADVYTPSVHINFTREFPHPSLKHELVHAFLRDFTPFSIGFHPNMVLTEGVAVALAPEDAEKSLHESAAFLLADPKLLEVEIEKIFSPWFWFESGIRAYSLAGSFVKYLLDEKDPAMFLKIYAGNNWRKVYGKSLSELILEWKTYLRKNFSTKVVGDLGLKNLMSQASIWKDNCPHYEATLLQKESTSYLDFRRPCTWKTSEYWHWRLAKNPQDVAALLQIQKAEFKKNQVNTISGLEIDQENWSSEKLDISLWQVDLLFLKEDFTQARLKLQEISDNSSNYKLPMYLQRAILVRKYLFEFKNQKYAKDWVMYLNHVEEIPDFEISKDEYGITLYLYLRRHPEAFAKHFSPRELSNYDKFFANNKILAKELLWVVARKYVLENDYESALRLLDHIFIHASSGRRIYIEEIRNLILEMKLGFQKTP